MESQFPTPPHKKILPPIPPTRIQIFLTRILVRYIRMAMDKLLSGFWSWPVIGWVIGTLWGFGLVMFGLAFTPMGVKALLAARIFFVAGGMFLAIALLKWVKASEGSATQKRVDGILVTIIVVLVVVGELWLVHWVNKFVAQSVPEAGGKAPRATASTPADMNHGTRLIISLTPMEEAGKKTPITGAGIVLQNFSEEFDRHIYINFASPEPITKVTVDSPERVKIISGGSGSIGPGGDRVLELSVPELAPHESRIIDLSIANAKSGDFRAGFSSERCGANCKNVAIVRATIGPEETTRSPIQQPPVNNEASKSPSPLHTKSFMQIERPVIRKEYSIIAPGKQWGGDIHSSNPGPGRLFNVFGNPRAYVVDVRQPGRNYDKEVLSQFNADLRDARRAYRQGKIKGLAEQGIGSGPWATVLTEPLTQRQCDGIFDGNVTIYFVTWFIWKDSEGHTDTATDCRWLQKLPKRDYLKNEIVWHYCQP